MSYASEIERPLAVTQSTVVDAVNHLIGARNFVALVKQMTKSIETWDRSPMVYGGHLACLNSLIDVGLQDRAAFDRLVKLADDKRQQDPGLRRVSYQRDLMRERRGRLHKALELRDVTFGVLRGAARMQEARAITKRWAVAKAQYLENQGPLSWHDRNEATAAFWATIDRQLEKNLEDARASPKARAFA